MKLYIDFDGTLYDTDRLYKDYSKICFKYKISSKEIEDAKKKLFSNTFFSLDTLTNYLTKNKNLSKAFLLEVENLYNPSYLFDDVLTSLEILSNNYELYLLTFGDASFQKKKIQGAKIEKYFKKIIITEKNKNKLNIDYKNSLFIDNNPKEIDNLICSKAHTVRLRRKEDKYSEYNSSNDCMEYESLMEFVKNNFKYD